MLIYQISKKKSYFTQGFRLILVIIGLISFSGQLISQSCFQDGLSADFHEKRRQAFREMMPDNSVAVFFTAPDKIRANDTYHTYRPDSDFYYFSGLREPNAALILFKDAQKIDGKETTSILYMAERDPRKEQWDGVMLGLEGARKHLGFEVVFSNVDFLKKPTIDWDNFDEFLAYKPVSLEENRHNIRLKSMMDAFYGQVLEDKKPNHNKLNEITNEMRQIKTPEEIVLIKKAVEISGKAHIEAMKSLQPGISERQIQAVHEFVHKSLGAEAEGYAPIVGAGNNSCILHYSESSKENVLEGLMLMDVGAEYRGYSGDITRTVPVKGKFSEEEKAIYQIVLNALNSCIEKAQPGSNFFTIEGTARKILNEGLIDLGLITGAERHPYIPHGTSHHLGLDVHDKGKYTSLEPGMVITVEPGIYIPKGSNVDPKWWGIGIRIEDDILITKDGNENLSKFVPRTIEEIEAVMTNQGILQFWQSQN
jgi:Xaa-Pro aminopeptidase